MKDIKKLLKKQEKKEQKSTDDILQEIIRADMEVMLKYGRNRTNLRFPEPVRPLWKN